MNNIDHQYQVLLQDILDNGVSKQDRTGTGTISVFGRQIRHKMSEGFPLLTTKKMHFKSIVTELLWFLRGDTNIKYLVDNNCHIWDGDAYMNYLKNFTPPECPPNLDVQPDYYEPMSKDMFIYGIKTDDEFAKKWGVTVEVRELSMEERWEIANLTPNMSEFDYCNKLCDEYNVPTKSISLTYDNRTEVIYE